MECIASTDIYLINGKDATSLPCLLSTSPTNNRTNKIAQLLILYNPNIL